MNMKLTFARTTDMNEQPHHDACSLLKAREIQIRVKRSVFESKVSLHRSAAGHSASHLPVRFNQSAQPTSVVQVSNFELALSFHMYRVLLWSVIINRFRYEGPKSTRRDVK